MSAPATRKPSVFIDGQAGTTGLDLRARLADRSDIELIEISEADRKSTSARAELLQAADVAILCLPDDAAVEAVGLIGASGTRVIDASTAHRIDPDFVYGLPELSREQRSRIAESQHVSNPGCYPQGYILTTSALAEAGLLKQDARLNVHAISGYSGGGRQMIESFEAAERGVNDPLAARPYGLTLGHKHVPEMQRFSGLAHAPLFVPTVCGYYKGMLVHVPLNGLSASAVLDCLRARYSNEPFVTVTRYDPSAEPYLDPTACNDTNSIELLVSGTSDNALVTARYDNLGKGAAGAALQSLNLMLGADEATGLSTINDRPGDL